MLRPHRRPETPEKVLHADDVIPDGRLLPKSEDLLDHRAIAHGVADLAVSVSAPTNIALFGAWGAGKSSVYTMITERIKELDDDVAVARYDAWKHGGRDLKRHFIESVGDDLGIQRKDFKEGLHQDIDEPAKLKLLSWVGANWVSLLIGTVVATVVAGLWVVVLAAARTWAGSPWDVAVRELIPAAGTVFGLALVALLAGPKILESATVRRVTKVPDGSDEFSARFGKLIEHVTENMKKTRLVVFVDELDRCAPDDVVATLVDLKTFLDEPSCVFIVAVDREVVEAALDRVPQAKPVRPDSPYYSTRGAFLDKIFQHQITLPPLRPRSLTRFAHELVREQGGIWSELRDQSAQQFDVVVFTLVPLHVRSPRRVKVLLNNFATNMRIVQARGIDAHGRALEVAAITVIQTEFPALAADLLSTPRLLAVLRGSEQPTPAAARVAAKYQNSGLQEAGAETAAGELLHDRRAAIETAQAANQLADDLSNYLSRIAAAGVPDPRPDLFYLQSAGQGEGLDTRTGEAIDFAAESAPSSTLALLSDLDPSRLALVVRLVAIEAERSFGPGRMFAIEVACRLVEQLEPHDLRPISSEVGSIILPRVGDEGWPAQASPGALALTSATGHREDVVVALVMHVTVNDDLPEDETNLSARALSVLPVLNNETADVVRRASARWYARSPYAFHHALSHLPLGHAELLWRGAAADVVDHLSSLETPLAEEAAAPRRTATRVASEPASTGYGQAALRRLITATTQRPDGDKLTAAVLGEALRASNSQLRSAAREDALRLFGELSDELAAVVNGEVIDVLADSDPDDYDTWAGLLRPPPASEPTSRAGQVLAEKLVPLLADVDEEHLPTLERTIEVVARCAVVDDAALANALTDTQARLEWDDALLRRRTVQSTAASLVPLVGQDFIDRLLVANVAAVYESSDLTEELVPTLVDLVSDMPASAAARLFQWLEDNTATDVSLTPLRLSMSARVTARAPAPPRETLSPLDDGALSTQIFEDYLHLRPAVDDVIAMIDVVSPWRGGLDKYAAELSSTDRTRLWIKLDETHVSNPVLSAVGRHGVDADAVTHTTAVVASHSRYEARKAALSRLTDSRPSRDRATETEKIASASGSLALQLLATNIAVNVRLAASVVIWARGGGRSNTPVLRRGFDAAVDSNAPLSQAETSALIDLGLLTRPKKRGGRRRKG